MVKYIRKLCLIKNDRQSKSIFEIFDSELNKFVVLLRKYISPYKYIHEWKKNLENAKHRN